MGCGWGLEVGLDGGVGFGAWLEFGCGVGFGLGVWMEFEGGVRRCGWFRRVDGVWRWG